MIYAQNQYKSTELFFMQKPNNFIYWKKHISVASHMLNYMVFAWKRMHIGKTVYQQEPNKCSYTKGTFHSYAIYVDIYSSAKCVKSWYAVIIYLPQCNNSTGHNQITLVYVSVCLSVCHFSYGCKKLPKPRKMTFCLSDNNFLNIASTRKRSKTQTTVSI